MGWGQQGGQGNGRGQSGQGRPSRPAWCCRKKMIPLEDTSRSSCSKRLVLLDWLTALMWAKPEPSR